MCAHLQGDAVIGITEARCSVGVEGCRLCRKDGQVR